MRGWTWLAFLRRVSYNITKPLLCARPGLSCKWHLIESPTAPYRAPFYRLGN